MPEDSLLRGEKIYEYDLDLTGITDFGVSLEAIMSGRESVPPQGARFDLAFAGRARGRICGAVSGIDYLRIRADGRIDLDIKATIATDDGHRIALAAGGVLMPRPDEPIVNIFENVSLTTAAADYAWVNTGQIWAVGSVNMTTGKVHVEAFMQ